MKMETRVGACLAATAAVGCALGAATVRVDPFVLWLRAPAPVAVVLWGAAAWVVAACAVRVLLAAPPRVAWGRVGAVLLGVLASGLAGGALLGAGLGLAAGALALYLVLRAADVGSHARVLAALSVAALALPFLGAGLRVQLGRA